MIYLIELKLYFYPLFPLFPHVQKRSVKNPQFFFFYFWQNYGQLNYSEMKLMG